MINHKAIYELYSNVTSIVDDAAFDINGDPVEIDVAAVEAWVDPEEYKMLRYREYPSIGDQLDDLFKQGAFSDEMTAKIQAVKDANPKGDE